MKPRLRPFLFASLLMAGTAWAQQSSRPPLEPIPESPPLPGPITEEDLIEPQVTIRKEGEDEVTEYRVGGRVYMIKVVPAHGGTPYYLIDRTGNGVMERFDGTPELSVPMWILKSW